MANVPNFTFYNKLIDLRFIIIFRKRFNGTGFWTGVRLAGLVGFFFVFGFFPCLVVPGLV